MRAVGLAHATAGWRAGGLLGLAALNARLWARACLGSAFELDLEMTTPFTSFSSVRAGAFLLAYGVDPYAPGSACLHPPLMLWPLSALHADIIFFMLIVAEAFTAWALLRMAEAIRPWHTLSAKNPPPPPRPSSAPSPAEPSRAPFAMLAPALYLLSPHVVFGCASLSTSSLSHAPMAAALALSSAGRPAAAAASLALCTYIAPDAIWLFPAVAFPLLSPEPQPHSGAPAGAFMPPISKMRRLPSRETSSGRALAFGVSWLLTGAALLLCSRLASGSWSFFSCYSAWATAAERTPNLGLWWYLFSVQILPATMPLLAAMHVLPHICLPHLVAALPSAPDLAAALSLNVATAFRPYPTGQDICFALSALAAQLSPHLLARTRRLPAALCVLCACTAAARSFWHGWLVDASLNANFLYAATLGLGGAQAVLVLDVAAAGLRAQQEAGGVGSGMKPPQAHAVQRLRLGSCREGSSGQARS